jgi:hypothetical protein
MCTKCGINNIARRETMPVNESVVDAWGIEPLSLDAKSSVFPLDETLTPITSIVTPLHTLLRKIVIRSGQSFLRPQMKHWTSPDMSATASE